MLIDVETLGNNEEFHKILGFINTDKNYQQKGEKRWNLRNVT